VRQCFKSVAFTPQQQYTACHGSNNALHLPKSEKLFVVVGVTSVWFPSDMHRIKY